MHIIEMITGLFGSHGGLDAIRSMTSVLSDASNLIFFQQINSFLNEEIAKFGASLLTRTMIWVSSVALTLLTIWIMIQGYRIITGQSRDSMMALVTNSLRASLIVAFATGFAIGGSSIFEILSNDVPQNINQVVTGSEEDAYKNIDRSLGYMQLAFSSIDALQSGGDPMVGDAKSRAIWFTGVGTGGPAITAGVMLLLNKIALALFTGLGPLFILCLLFDQTKQLFGRWLFYGLGTMFSLAVLSVMVGLALDVVVAVAKAFWVGKLLGGSSEGVNSMSMQQGGLGLILTMLIISAPPMAAAFFQGTLGNFTAFSQFGGGARHSPGAHGPGSPPASSYANHRPVDDRDRDRDSGGFNNPATNPYQPATAVTANEIRTMGETRMGNANVPSAPVRPPVGPIG
ncbi:MAG: type IV secretion system protein [Arenimonas sp.]